MTTLAGCAIPFDILEKFPHQVYGLFISNADPSLTDSSAIADNIPAMIAHIEKCGQGSADMGDESVIADPYTTRLLELDGLAQIRDSKRSVMLESLEIYTYDPKIIGSSEQDTDINTAVTGSISSQNQILSQSTYLYGMFGQVQPSFIRPFLAIDDRPYLTGLRSGNKAVSSIGLPTPLCRQFYKELPPPDKINFTCGAASWIPSENKLRRLFVLGVLNFRLQQPL